MAAIKQSAEPTYADELRARVLADVLGNGSAVKAAAAAHGIPLNVVAGWIASATDRLPLIVSGPPPGDTVLPRPAGRGFRPLIETSRDAIVLFSDHGFFDCNDSALAIFGVGTVDEFIRLAAADLSPAVQPNGRDSAELLSEYSLRAVTQGSYHFEWTYRRLNGADFEADVLFSCLHQAGRPILQATVRDISQLKSLQRELSVKQAQLTHAHDAIERQNRELAQLCVTDELTGIFNRRKLDDVLQTESEFTQRYDLPLAIIIADIDGFKRVNDTCGHHVGDEVLRAVAELLGQSVRSTDVLGRWGGEEFLVVCSGSRAHQARTLAERMRAAVEKLQFERSGPVTCSFGVAPFDAAQGVDAMIREADGALEEAKLAGRNRVMVSPRREPRTGNFPA